MESYDVNKPKQKIKGGYTENVDKRSGGQTQVTILNKIKGKNGGVLLFVLAVLIWLIVITSLMQTRSTPEKVNCMWSDWSNSSTCTKTCGRGKQLQTRFIKIQEGNGGAPCTGENIQEIDCNPNACAARVDGRWGEWVSLTKCSKSCGSGERSRYRSCDDPAPEHGGKTCIGPALDTAKCDEGPCPDPCIGVECGYGFKKVTYFGNCQCVCGSNLFNSVWYDFSENVANVCDVSAAGSLGHHRVTCGIHDKCGGDQDKPFCLDQNSALSARTGRGGIPAVGDQNHSVSCQCNSSSQCTSDPTTPFCGNFESKAGLNPVAIGTCGRCQEKAAGGGRISTCTKSSCPNDFKGKKTSCGENMVCCSTGECQSSNRLCTA